MGRRGFSMRMVLVSLALAALGVVAWLFWLSDAAPRSEPSAPEASTFAPNGEPLAPLETAADPRPARTDAPEEELRKPGSSAGDRTLVIAGTAIEAGGGAAVPGVVVEGTWGALPLAERVRATAVADAAGRYSLQLIVPPELPGEPGEWSVGIQAVGERFWSARVVLDQPHFRCWPVEGSFLAERNLEVQVFYAIRGRIVRASDGAPVPEANVALLWMGETPRSGLVVTSDESGSFLLRFQMLGQAPFDLGLFVTAAGYGAKTVPALLDRERVVEIGDIALSEGACVEGFVTTPSGAVPTATEVIANARVSGGTLVTSKEGSWMHRDGAFAPTNVRAPIGPDGSFRLCGLASEEYVLTASYHGCTLGSDLDSLVVRAPASGVALLLARAVYRIEVINAQTDSRIWSPVFHFDGGQGIRCDLGGDFVIATEPGIASAGRIIEPGYRVLKCTLPALAPGEVRQLEYRLEPLSSQVPCLLVVTSPAGTPVRNIEAEFRGGMGDIEGQIDMNRQTYRAKSGRHRLPRLVPGTYRLLIEPLRGDDPAEAMWLGGEFDLEVREGRETIEVQLRKGGLLSAAVTRSDGKGELARASLVRPGAPSPELLDWRSDAGTPVGGWIPIRIPVRLEKPLPGGRCTIRFEAEGCTSRDVDVDVQPGRTVAIEVNLEPVSPR